jgi:hypothetical protein
VWCEDNNLHLNVSKTKELIVEYRKRRAEHAPIHIDGAEVERIESFKFLGVHITNKLSWSKHTKTVMKRARQPLFTLRRLKKFGMGPAIQDLHTRRCQRKAQKLSKTPVTQVIDCSLC